MCKSEPGGGEKQEERAVEAEGVCARVLSQEPAGRTERRLMRLGFQKQGEKHKS